MDSKIAVDALSALALASRLDVFRLLVKAGPEGVAAGDIARAIDARPNTLSANLNVLSGAGLVGSQQAARLTIPASGAQMEASPAQQSSMRKARRSRMRS